MVQYTVLAYESDLINFELFTTLQYIAKHNRSVNKAEHGWVAAWFNNPYSLLRYLDC